MKWPNTLTLIRHDVSKFNALRESKAESELYQRFIRAWKTDPASNETIALATIIQEDFALGVGDANTPLADPTGSRAIVTGQKMPEFMDLPDIVFVSPYLRTKETLRFLAIGWPELQKVPVVEDDRVREQEHGLALLYNDWRVFHALHPDQRKLFELEGPYWYRYPQGESVADTRARNREHLAMLIREYAGKNVLVVTHHLNILATIANLERWSAAEFIEMDTHAKPVNCGVTLFTGVKAQGRDGKLRRTLYNVKCWE